MSIIETQGLTKIFGKTVAVEDVDLSVEAGEVLGLLGPNGAGKTTTMRMLSGMIAPTRGQAVVNGMRPDQEPERLHESIGLLTESPGGYARLSALQNLEFFGGFYPGIDSRAQAEKYLRLMGLWERRNDKAGTFSKGMKQRLALARCLLHEPKIVLLDEPTAGLDPEASAELRGLIRSLGEEGRTILLSTHNLTEAEELCRRVAVIRGKLLAVDTPERLRQRFFRRQLVVKLATPNPLVTETVRELAFVQELREEGPALLIDLTDPERFRPDLVEAIVKTGGRVESVTEEQHPLEEAYLKLIHEEQDK